MLRCFRWSGSRRHTSSSVTYETASKERAQAGQGPRGTLASPLQDVQGGLPKRVREVLSKARVSWLKNTEVLDVLHNFRSYGFVVSQEPPCKPPGAGPGHPCHHRAQRLWLACDGKDRVSSCKRTPLAYRMLDYCATVAMCWGASGWCSSHFLVVSQLSAGFLQHFILTGGSLFLFNRKAVRFFRKDGHDWRKKSDGKTVRETHEKLKVTAGILLLAAGLLRYGELSSDSSKLVM